MVKQLIVKALTRAIMKLSPYSIIWTPTDPTQEPRHIPIPIPMVEYIDGICNIVCDMLVCDDSIKERSKVVIAFNCGVYAEENNRHIDDMNEQYALMEDYICQLIA